MEKTLKEKLKEKEHYEKKLRAELYAVLGQINLLKELLGEKSKNLTEGENEN